MINSTYKHQHFSSWVTVGVTKIFINMIDLSGVFLCEVKEEIFFRHYPQCNYHFYRKRIFKPPSHHKENSEPQLAALSHRRLWDLYQWQEEPVQVAWNVAWSQQEWCHPSSITPSSHTDFFPQIIFRQISAQMLFLHGFNTSSASTRMMLGMWLGLFLSAAVHTSVSLNYPPACSLEVAALGSNWTALPWNLAGDLKVARFTLWGASGAFDSAGLFIRTI